MALTIIPDDLLGRIAGGGADGVPRPMPVPRPDDRNPRIPIIRPPRTRPRVPGIPAPQPVPMPYPGPGEIA